MKQREIKFKAWHKEEKLLCRVVTLTDDGAFLIGVKKGKDQIQDRTIVYAPDDGRFCKMEEIVLIQYTGWKDKKGVEIFEGDIRRGNYFCMNDPTETIQVCEWDDEGGCYFWKCVRGGEMPDFIGTEIVGNIYENAWLLAATPK